MMTRTGRRFSILFAAIAALAKTGSAAARREFLRSARVLAAAACLALVGALALPPTAEAQTDTTPPTLSSAVVIAIGDTLYLNFSENLALNGPAPNAVQSAFTVTADGADHAHLIPYTILGITDRLVIEFSSKIYPGQTVVVSYNQSVAGGDALADAAGNEVASFTTGSGGVPAVTNNSTAEAQTPPTCTLNPGDIWCGVVTVGALEGGGETFAYGFSDPIGQGDLSDKMFSVVTTGVTTPYIIDFAYTDNVGILFFSLTSALTAADQAKLVLHVGSASFAFSVASYGSFGYTWSSTGLDWSSEDYVTLRLREAAVLPGLSVWDAAASGGSDMAFTVTLSEAAAEEVTATWTASIEFGNTAVAADLGSPTTGMVTFAPNATTARFVLRFPQSDHLGDRTFRVTLSGVSANAQLVSNWIATGTIIGTPT